MADQNNRGDNSRRRPQKYDHSNSKDHNYLKRSPHKYESSKNVFYVGTKCSIKTFLEKCNKLILDEEEKEIIIYCLGAAIQKGILLALQICDSHPNFDNDVQTLTTQLTDDLEPLTETADYVVQRRRNSGLRIRVFKTDHSTIEPVQPSVS